MTTEGTLPAKILIVDDQPANVRLLEGILRNAGYRTAAVACGAAVEEAVRAEAPEVVLLDVMLPDIDGFEVCRRLKKDDEAAFLPVVMVTALQEKEHLVRALEAGADDYLGKPVDTTELLARVKSLARAKRLHGALQRSYAELQEVRRMQENLTHLLVHDMRSPLTGILGSLELIRECSPPDGPVGACCEGALKNARTLRSMIDEMLDITRMEHGAMSLDLQPVEIRETAAGVLEEADVAGRSLGLRLEARIPDGLPPLRADRRLLRRVLANLVGNALHYTPSGGAVTLSAGRPADRDGMILLSVADSGGGIPAEHRDRIFEKFFRVGTAARGDGTSAGLGLAFCRMAVEAHGGRIWVEAPAGGGSDFRFLWPAEPGARDGARR